MSLYFVRHGATISTAEGRIARNEEVLTTEGREDAREAGNELLVVLCGDPLQRIIASPRVRTKEAAALIAREISFEGEIEEDDRLAERNCGAYEGQPVQDVFSRSEEELVAGGMEPTRAVYDRLTDFVGEVNGMSGDILIVGHSGNIKPLVAITRGVAVEDLTEVPPLDSDGILKLT